MRRCRMSVALAAALAALTLSATAEATGSQVGILDRFLPVLVFHPGEEFRPGTVQTFVEDSSLEAATSPTTWVVVDPTPSANDLPDLSPPVWRLNQRDCFAGAPLGDLACYVAAGGTRGEPTIFERIAAREIPAQIVAETDRVIAFRDIAPKAPVHVVVTPKRGGYRDVVELAEGDPELLAELVSVARGVAADLADGDFRMVFNTGGGAGQTVASKKLFALLVSTGALSRARTRWPLHDAASG